MNATLNTMAEGLREALPEDRRAMLTELPTRSPEKLAQDAAEIEQLISQGEAEGDAAKIADLTAHNAELLAELELQRESNDKMRERNAVAKELVEALEGRIKELEGQADDRTMAWLNESDALKQALAVAEFERKRAGDCNALLHDRISELEQQNAELGTESGLPGFAEEIMDEASSCGRKFMDERNTGIMADFRIELGKLAEESRGVGEGLAFDAVCAARDVQRALFTSEVMSGCAEDAREGRQLVLETRLLLCDHVLRMVANTRGFIDWQLAKPAGAPEARKV